MGECFILRDRTARAVKAGAERKERVLAAGAELERGDGAALAAQLEQKLAAIALAEPAIAEPAKPRRSAVAVNKDGSRFCWTLETAEAEYVSKGPKAESARKCAVPGKDLHNNTIRILERSLQAAGTDGYADTESGTSSRCAVRVPKGYRD